MEELSLLFGILGNITAVLVSLSPTSTFLRIIKNRSTGEFESFPYICMLLNASLWTYYGIIKPNALLLATVNGFGVIVQTIYLSLFLLCAPPKTRKIVVTAKSVEYMPFLLSFFLCVNGITWAIYAILVRDYFIGVPNGMGFVLGASQLVLYAMYKTTKPSNSAIGVLEEGWQQHQQLIVPSSD